MSEGYIYVLSNPSMPGLYKVGRTINGARRRAKEIYQTGVPTPFELEFEIFSFDIVVHERNIHEELDEYRVNRGREFFKANPEEIIKSVCNVVLSDHNIGCEYWDGYVTRDCIDQYCYTLSKHDINAFAPEVASALSFYLTEEELKTLYERYMKEMDIKRQ